jgi:hypothetical protein
MPETMAKVRELRRRCPGLHIQVDGGIGLGNVQLVAEAGACTAARCGAARGMRRKAFGAWPSALSSGASLRRKP